MKKTEALSVGEIISRAIAATGNADEYARQQAVFLWPEIVGPTINRHTTRRYIDGETMHVYLNSPVLKNELMYLTDSIRDKINGLMERTVVSKIIIH